MVGSSLTNYISYVEPSKYGSRIGHFDPNASTIQPLSFASGTPIRDLYQVIEAGEANIIAEEDTIPASSVRILPPISGRDVRGPPPGARSGVG